MWTDSEDRPHPAAAYHGLASIAVAAVLLLMALPALQLAFWLQAANYPGWGADDKKLAAYGGYIGVLVTEILCLVGAGIGFRGAGLAERTREPAILCTAGVALSLFAAVLWFACGFAWHSQAWRFIR